MSKYNQCSKWVLGLCTLKISVHVFQLKTRSVRLLVLYIIAHA